MLAGVCLFGCASTPSRERPALGFEVPHHWAADSGEGAEQPPGTEEVPWWDSFGDDNLSRLVEEVLANNRDLAAASARVEAAVAEVRIAGADLLPQATGEFSPTRSRRNFIGFPIPGGGRVLSTTTTTYGVSINVSWEADLWGRMRARKGAALANLGASQEDLASAALSLAGQAAKSWWAVQEAASQVALARETLENRRLTRERIQRRYELGIRSPLDLRLAIANEAGATATLARRERQLDAAKRQLELLLSRYPDGVLDGAGNSFDLPEAPDPVPLGMPSELLVRRPDLRAAERRLAASGLAVKEARAALYPRLRFTGSAGRQGEGPDDLRASEFTVWSLAASLLQPLFQGGRLRAGVEAAQARYRELIESYVQAVLVGFNEVESALAAERFLSRQEESLDLAARQSLAARDLAEDRYDSGLADYLSLLEAQREAALARSQHLEVRRQLLDARVDLHLALGGDFKPESPSEGALPPSGDAGPVSRVSSLDAVSP